MLFARVLVVVLLLLLADHRDGVSACIVACASPRLSLSLSLPSIAVTATAAAHRSRRWRLPPWGRAVRTPTPLLAGAVAFVHPSVNESLGIVLLEAWLARTPCLVHARGVVLRDQCRRSGGGLWFKSYAQFEEEVLLLLDDGITRNALAESGRAFVLREYAWSAVEKRMMEALDEK